MAIPTESGQLFIDMLSDMRTLKHLMQASGLDIGEVHISKLVEMVDGYDVHSLSPRQRREFMRVL